MTRFRDAVLIQVGACNPSGVARALVKAIDEARADGAHAREDAAVRMIAHQLAFLLDIAEIDASMDVYRKLSAECESRQNAT